MATIRTGIELNDNFSGVMNGIINSVNICISTIEEMQRTMNTGIDTASLAAARGEIAQAAAGFERMGQNIQGASAKQENFNRYVNNGGAGVSNLAKKVLGVVGAYASISGAVNGIKDVLSAEDTQIEAETKLTTVMQQRMGATSQTVQSVKDLTAAQQSLGVVGDEVQMAGAQQMATFLNNSDALETLIPAMNNLAVQQNGVATSGENMKNIANMMGKAMQGQVSALTRVGITMTEAEQKALKNGNEMERASMLAQIITNNVGDMNAAIANTPQGMMQQMSNTWGDMKEVIGGQLYPVVYNLFNTIMANQPAIEQVLGGVANGLNVVINVLTNIISGVSQVAGFIQDNWPAISAVVYGIVAALGVYMGYLALVKAAEIVSAGIKAAMCIAAYAHAAATGTEVAATTAATAAQTGLNTAMLACPLTWIILLIAALIAVVIAVANHIAKMGGTATTAFGVICGGVNVVLQFFKNLGLTVANIARGIGNAIAALGSNIEAAFYNAICNVESFLWDLLSAAMDVIEGICKALNKLPFIEFDYSGVSQAADDYASKAAEASDNRKEYKSISDAFDEGYSSFDTFQDGWETDAYAKGAKWGDGVSDKLKKSISGKNTQSDTNKYQDMIDKANKSAGNKDGNKGGNDVAQQTAQNTAKTADSANKIAKSVDITSEDLKYLRDIAERDVVNRYTTAAITVKQTNHNTINNDMDLDGVTEHLRSTVEEQMAAAAGGVY